MSSSIKRTLVKKTNIRIGTIIIKNLKKLISYLRYDDNFIGTELDLQVSYADIAKACGVNGVQVRTMEAVTSELGIAVKSQMDQGETTFIEVILNQELGDPFRRDAMKTPVPVAGISINDMCPQ